MAGMLPSPLKFPPEDAGVAAFDPTDLEDPSVSLGSFSRDIPVNNNHHHLAMDEGGGGVGVAAAPAAAGEEIDKTESVGSKKKRAEMWQDSEMDALVSAYKQVHMKLLLAGKNGKHVFKSANEKWTEVRNLLLPMGVDRQPKEIERKWSNLLTAYKQIVEWNKKIGHPSYWDLDDVLKKEKTKAKELPATFRVQLFESMAEFLGDRNGRRTRCLDPSAAAGNGLPTGNSGLPGSSAAAGNSGNASLARFEMALGQVDVPICLDKLGSQLIRNLDGSLRRPGVILVATGSFNPPTIMHLRMFELARNRLMSEGYSVLGGYMSPVHDGYSKPGLALAEHRIQMCQIATVDSPFIMVDSWEARQPARQRTVDVLARIDHCINGGMITEGTVRIMLLCGVDLLATMQDANIWIPEHVERICRDYGIVCLSRDGQGIDKVVFQNEILHRHRRNILAMMDMAQIGVSSTVMRQSFERALSVKYLVHDGVIEYVKSHRLYNYRND